MPLQVQQNSPIDSSSVSAPGKQLSTQSFMTLLVAQLKQQDPSNAQDPTQWIGQLVQFNSLEQLVEINQKLTSA